MSDINPDRYQQALNLLVSKFQKRYGVKTTKYLYALLQALAVGDGFIDTQIESVRDNLIAVTASGKYLDRAAGRYGIVRGQGTGVLDPDFRRLVPLLGLSAKQISHIILQIIDTIYGPYSSHANVSCMAPEPYNLTSGFGLNIIVEGQPIQVVFDSFDALNLSAATASELATAISKKTDGRIIGSVVSDAKTGNRFVNIRTSTIGSQGFIQVTGGDAQSIMEFPTIRPVNFMGLATYDVTRYLGTDEMIFTITAGPVPDYKAAGVVRGDMVTIRSDSGFDIHNIGSYKVTFVGTNFFRLENANGIPESGITQVHLDDFTFFDSEVANILISGRPAALVETSPRELTILLPVTSPVVKRTLKGGHHFHQGISTVMAATSNSVTLAAVTGFETTGAIKPLLARNDTHGIVSTTGATTVSLISAEGWPTAGSFWASNVRQFFYFQGIIGNVLQNVTPTPPSELAGATVLYIERYMYSGISVNTLTGVFPDPSALVNQEVFACGANINSNFPGSFLYDPGAQFIAAEEFTTIGETVREGSVKTLLKVGDVSDFTSTGSFVLEFGTETQEGPIRYFAKVGTQGLIVDPSHIFERDHLEGVGLRMVRQIGPYAPRETGEDLAVYTTSTSPARDLIASYLRLIAAAGVRLRFIINTPDFKWPVLPNLYTTGPLDTELVSV